MKKTAVLTTVLFLSVFSLISCTKKTRYSPAGPVIVPTSTIGAGADIYEDDDTYTLARTIVPGSPEIHTFHDSCDSDWVKFSVQQNRSYRIETTAIGTSDTYLRLYTSDGSTMIAEDDDSGSGLASLINYVAPSNTVVYVKVSELGCNYGAGKYYTLNVTESSGTLTPANTPTYTPTPSAPDAYEDDDTVANARTIAVGSPETHTSHDACDYDWYKFSATANVQYTFATSAMGTNSTVYIYVYNTTGTSYYNYSCSYSTGVGTTLSWIAPADGVYYVRIYQYSCSTRYGANTNYTFQITAGSGTVTPTFTRTFTYTPTYTPTPSAPDAYEDDDTYLAARTIAPGVSETHTSHDTCDYDWFKFTTVAGLPYTFSTSAMGTNSCAYIYIYDTTGTSYLTYNYSSTPGYGTTVSWTAPTAGTYYVRINQYSCSSRYGANTNYTFQITAGSATVTPTFTATYTPTPSAPDPYEDDDTVANARTIAVGVSETHTSHDSCDYDWYKFSATGNVQYTFATSAMGVNSVVYIYIYNTTGSSYYNYACSYSTGYGTTLNWIAPADGVYYVQIYQYNCSTRYGADTNYTFQITAGSGTVTPTFTRTFTYTPTYTPTPSAPDAYEDDDTYLVARTIAPGVSETHTSHDACDYDWYKFSTTANVPYTFTTTAMGTNSCVYIYIYDTNGTSSLTYNYSSSPGYGTTVNWIAPASGTYYARISQYSCSGRYGANTNYTFQITAGAGTVTPTFTRTNTATPTNSPTPSAPDAYEDDDTYLQAKNITIGTTGQLHNADSYNDQDYMYFSATAGTQYTLETFNTSQDTYLYLYDTNGTTMIAADDDSGVGTASLITWTPTVSGNYYLMVRMYNASNYGTAVTYWVKVTTP